MNFKLTSLTISSILLLSACATHSDTTADKIADKNYSSCCSNKIPLNIPDFPYLEKRLSSTDMREQSETVTVEPSMTIDAEVFFDFNQSKLTDSAKQLIANIAHLALKNTEKRIHLIGTTDFLGTDKYNSKLAKNRAVVVKNEFVKNGISENDIDIAIYLSPKDQTVIDNCDQSVKQCIAKDRHTSITIKLDM